MKIDLRIYLAKNLGDDLFLDILSKRYPSTNFHICPIEEYDHGIYRDNVKIYNGYFTRKFNVLCNKLKLYKIGITNQISKKCDFSLVIGGSIFQESPNWKLYKKKLSIFRNLNSTYLILGCNFGPYISKDFLNIHSDVIKNAKDVCFRDKKSYELFSNLKNTRCCGDIVFSMDTKEILIREEKKVIISMIDLSWREKFKQYQEIYENKILEIIDYFSNKNYKIILMSFSKLEGDERAINRVYDRLDKEHLKKVEKWFYNGNIDETINTIASSKIIVATRFHANILGFLFNKSVISISYSNKIDNLLDDIKFKGIRLKIEEINKFDTKLLKSDVLNYKVDISKERESASEQFKILDKILK